MPKQPKLTIDLGDAKYISDFYEIICSALGLPHGYFCKLDALRHVIWRHVVSCGVEIKGVAGLPQSLKEYALRICSVFDEAA